MARIIMQPSGKSVDCAYGDTVLMALEKAGYALPNNCRAGACGECKVKVTQGQFDQGMVLAASDTAGQTPGIFLLSPDSGAQPGMRVK